MGQICAPSTPPTQSLHMYACITLNYLSEIHVNNYLFELQEGSSILADQSLAKCVYKQQQTTCATSTTQSTVTFLLDQDVLEGDTLTWISRKAKLDNVEGVFGTLHITPTQPGCPGTECANLDVQEGILQCARCNPPPNQDILERGALAWHSGTGVLHLLPCLMNSVLFKLVAMLFLFALPTFLTPTNRIL
jgi:hypothetical protein